MKKNYAVASICALFTLSLLFLFVCETFVCEAQVLNIPIPGLGNRPKNKQYRTAEDILKTPQDTSELGTERGTVGTGAATGTGRNSSRCC